MCMSVRCCDGRGGGGEVVVKVCVFREVTLRCTNTHMYKHNDNINTTGIVVHYHTIASTHLAMSLQNCAAIRVDYSKI